MKKDFAALVRELMAREAILYAVFSGPDKVTVRPVAVKGERCYQLSELRGKQMFHRTLSASEASEWMVAQPFKQALICTAEEDFQVLKGKQTTILKKPPSRKEISLQHNRQKRYVLEEGTPVPFFVELGIMTKEGKVVPRKSDKFRQINRFLEMVQDVVPKGKALRIVDFGCGKAYLTFALYHYLHIHLGIEVEIVGLDLKRDVVEHCQQLAYILDYKGLTFLVGDIKDYKPEGKIDMVVTLHACDTATDAALAKAVEWDADVILSVPCCQHELFQQIKNQELNPLLKQGILKERFAALVTDAARAQILEILGYQTQIMEFIDLEHTPKNLLIRAVRGHGKERSRLEEEYRLFKKTLSIQPALESYLIGKKEISC
jgi:SAM-dependent methyltransferase